MNGINTDDVEPRSSGSDPDSHRQLTIAFGWVQNLVLSQAPPADVQHSNTKVKGSDAKSSSKSIASEPQFLIEIDSIVGDRTPIRSRSYSAAGERIPLDFRTVFDLELDENLFQILITPLHCRIKTNTTLSSTDDPFTHTLQEFTLNLSAFLTGDIMIESCCQTPSALIMVHLYLDRHIFSEFQIERQAIGCFSIETISGLPMEWISATTTATASTSDTAVSNRSNQTRIRLQVTIPFVPNPIDIIQDHSSNDSQYQIGYRLPLFFTEQRLASIRNPITDAKISIDLILERLNDDDWIRDPILGRAELPLQQYNQNAHINVIFESVSDSNSITTLSMCLQIDIPITSPTLSIDDLLPASESIVAPSRPVNATETLRRTTQRIVKMLKTKYGHHDDLSQLQSNLISDGVQILIKEMLKGPVIAMAKELSPGRASVNDLRHPIKLYQLYRAMSAEVHHVFSQEFYDDMKPNDWNQDHESDIVIGDRQRRQILEATILDDQRLRVVRLRERAQMRDIDCEDGIPYHLEYVKGLFQFGDIEEGIDTLLQLLSHHRHHLEIRTMLACAWLEQNPQSSKAASLLRLNLQADPISDVVFALRTVTQLIQGDTKIARQNLSRARLQHWDVFAIAADYALQVGLPRIAMRSIECSSAHSETTSETPERERPPSADTTGLAPAPDAPKAQVPDGSHADGNDTIAANLVMEQKGSAGLDMEFGPQDVMLVRQTRVWVLLNEFDRAADGLKQVLAKRPDDYELLKSLSLVYSKMHLDSDAARCWEQLLSHQSTPDLICASRLGKYYLDSGNYSNAIHVLMHCLQREPLSLIWKWLGDAYRFLGDFHHAVQALTQANLLNRLDAEVWALLIICCLHLDRVHEAMHGIKILAQLGPIDRRDLRQDLSDLVKKTGIEELVELEPCFHRDGIVLASR